MLKKCKLPIANGRSRRADEQLSGNGQTVVQVLQGEEEVAERHHCAVTPVRVWGRQSDELGQQSGRPASRQNSLAPFDFAQDRLGATMTAHSAAVR